VVRAVTSAAFNASARARDCRFGDEVAVFVAGTGRFGALGTGEWIERRQGERFICGDPSLRRVTQALRRPGDSGPHGEGGATRQER
jgi:hypothetical protein